MSKNDVKEFFGLKLRGGSLCTVQLLAMLCNIFTLVWQRFTVLHIQGHNEMKG